MMSKLFGIVDECDDVQTIYLYRRKPKPLSEQVAVIVSASQALGSDSTSVHGECSSSPSKVDTPEREEKKEAEPDTLEPGTYVEIDEDSEDADDDWYEVEVYSGWHGKRGFIDARSFVVEPALPDAFKDRMKYLYLVDDTISDFLHNEDVMQGAVNDCFALAPLAAFARTDWGRAQIKEMLTYDDEDDSYDVDLADANMDEAPDEDEDDGEEVGSSRVDLQACKLEYSIVSPK